MGKKILRNNMATFLFHDLIYGPIKSRRLGNSLGINLLPLEKKYCNFNCIYCECGANLPGRVGVLAKRTEVVNALRQKLSQLKQENIELNSITFAGNGEPTIHPDFKEIISDTIDVRNQYFENAQISVLSNATKISDIQIVDTLKKVDNCILKLDSAIDKTAIIINRPVGRYSVENTVNLLKRFDGNFVLQTMFLSGEVCGQRINNYTPEEVEAWLQIVKTLSPKKVMIYTIARDTPEKKLEKAPHEALEQIRQQVERLGIEISVSE